MYARERDGTLSLRLVQQLAAVLSGFFPEHGVCGFQTGLYRQWLVAPFNNV